MHAAWDLAHHFWGNPIWPFMPASSWGCKQDLRLPHRDLVPGRRTGSGQARRAGVEPLETVEQAGVADAWRDRARSALNPRTGD